MPTKTTPDLMQALAAAIRREAEQPWQRMLPRHFAALARHCDYALEEGKAIQQEAVELLAEGVEAGAFRERCQANLAALEYAIDVFEFTRQQAQQVLPTKHSAIEVSKALASIENVLKGLVEIRHAFIGYLRTASRPEPQVDWKKLHEEARADRKAGRYLQYESVEEMARDVSDGK